MAARDGLLARLRRWLTAPTEAALVCEIAADYVAAVRQQDGRIQAWAVRPLPEGAVQPGPLGDNIANSAVVQEALERVAGVVGDGQRRCALLVPDLVARVALLEFDRLPDNQEEAEALLRWRLSRDLPFDVRQAVLSYQAQPGRGPAQEVMVAVSARTLLRQYEECVERLGMQPGWVTLSTLAAAGWLESSDTPQLLVKRDHASLGLAIVHGSALRVFRSLPIPAATSALSDAALFEKIFPAAVYFQEQWGQPVGQMVLAGGARERAALAPWLQREAGFRVVELDLETAGLPPSPLSGAAADHRLVASVGWVRGGIE